MKHYFHLQITRAKRQLRDFGIHPFLGALLLVVAFMAFSVFAFYKTVYAPFALVVIAIVFLQRLSAKPRCDFLLSLFGQKAFRKLRLMENALLVLPILLVLLVKQAWLVAGLLVLVAGLMALLRLRTFSSWVIPTPFGKKPFEFAVGFRNSFPLFLVAYTLAGIAVNVGNINLGLFAVLCVYLTTLAFYSKPEDELYVWNFKGSAERFLWKKLWIGQRHAALLALPAIVIVGFGFPVESYKPIAAAVVGALYLCLFIVGKYAAYPKEPQLPQAILMGLAFLFPPAILALLPYFFHKSRSRLQTLLP